MKLFALAAAGLLFLCAAHTLATSQQGTDDLKVTSQLDTILSSLETAWQKLNHLEPTSKERQLQLLRDENEWKNSLVMWIVPDAVRAHMPHYLQIWFRNYVLTMVVYFLFGGAWCYYIYFCFGDKLFKPGHTPGAVDMLEQIKVAMCSIPLYAVMPTFNEFAQEQGWTKAYARIQDVGYVNYVGYMFLYMLFVEFGIYWVHRLLHDIQWAYKYIHYPHHKYNKEHTLSPFAGLAFHPLDGMLQASPYTLTLFLVPIHALSLELLLFATGIWTTNIHDNVHGNVLPIMGAGYHTLHHTTYKHNYGQYFVLFDWLFGTLESPEQYERLVKAKEAKAA